MRERKKPALSFNDSDRQRLRAFFADGRELEDAVLYVMFCTSLRVSDVLGIHTRALQAALRSPHGVLEVVQKGGSKRQLPVDGATAAWQKLGESCEGTSAATVAEAICPTSSWGNRGGGGAYQRCNRRLRAVAAQLEIDGRPHLHRIRRTIATAALRRTKDVHLVSQLLGHKSVKTTEIYLDEVRSDEVAALQRDLLGDD